MYIGYADSSFVKYYTTEKRGGRASPLFKNCFISGLFHVESCILIMIKTAFHKICEPK